MTRTNSSGLCFAHDVQWCIVCVTDDLQDAHYTFVENARARRKAWRETPMHEKFDLGGEA